MKSNNNTRSETFIAHCQLRELVDSLKIVVTSGNQVDTLSRQLLIKLREDFVRYGNGNSGRSHDFPDVHESSTASDLLILASVLYGTSQAFLTEQEVENIASRTANFLGEIAKAKTIISK